MSSSKVFACLAIFALTLGSVAWSQTNGSLRGVVTDTESQPLPGAMVMISSDALIEKKRITYTSEIGVFRFPSLPIGGYSIQVTMEGYETVKVAAVDISLQATAFVPVQMKFASKTEAITVISDTPIVDLTDSGFSTTYRNELLKEVPTQRQMTDLMQVAPGISPGIGDSFIDRAVAFGSNVQSNSWNIDGLDISGPESGVVQWSVNPDMIQEIQVMGVGAPAEYGNHTGAVFNVVTKKGGNQFHGGTSFYYQNDSLTGTNVKLEPADQYCGGDCATFHRVKYQNISTQSGGPILKNKLSFFAGFEYFRDARSNPLVDPAYAPVDAKDRYDIKLTGNLGNNHELNGFFHYEDWGYGGQIFPNYEPSAMSNQHGSNPAWGGGLTSTLSNNLLIDLNYSGWWSDSIQGSSTGSLEDPFFDANPPDGSGIPHFSGGVMNPKDAVAWKNQVKGKATYYAENFLRSAHEFKFGVQYAYSSVLNNVGIGANGIYTYSNAYGLFRAYQDPFQYGAINNDLGFFIDDMVNVSNKLTLNLGIRFDHNTGHMPEFEILTTGQPSVSSVGHFAKTGKKTSSVDVLNWNIISPRLGIIYQPRGDGHSIIQGSFGVYYDHNVSGNWDYPAPGIGTFAIYKFNSVTNKFDLPGPPPILPENVSINPNLRPPRTLQYSVGYEHQIGQSMAFGTQYVYKTTKDLVGWEILGGKYEQVPFTDPYNGKQYTLLSIIDSPIFRKGNDPGDFPGSENLDYFQKYHGLIFTFDKRLSKNWSLATSYTWSRSTGLIPLMIFQGQGPAFSFLTPREGRDPNQYINAEGRLQGDRPHMFRVLSYLQNLPGGLHASVNADFSTGKHHVRVIDTGLDAPPKTDLLIQQDVQVIMQRGYRIDPIQAIDVTVGRRFEIGRDFRILLDGTIFNLLNTGNVLGLSSQRLVKPATEFTAFNWAQPRRLQIRAGFEF